MRRRNILIYAVSIVLTIICLMPAGVLAASSGSTSGQTDKTTKTVKVGYFESDGFMEGASDGAVKTGYGYDVLQEISKYTGWKYEYVYGEWPELYDKLIKGEIDLFPSISKTTEREGQMEFPDYAMDTEINSLFVRSDDYSMDADDLSTINGKKVAVIKDNNMTKDFIKWIGEKGLSPELVYYDDVNGMVDELEAGRVDGYTGSEGNVDSSRNVKVLTQFAEGDIFLAVKKGDKKTLSQVNYAMGQIENNTPDFYKSLQKEYYGKSKVNTTLTEEERDWVEKHGKIRLGYVDDYMPYCSRNEDGKVTGLISDYMEQMLSAMEIADELKIKYICYENDDQLSKAVAHGEIDAAFPIPNNGWYTENSDIMTSDVIVNVPVSAVFKGEYSEDLLSTIVINKTHALQKVYQKTYLSDSRIIEVSSTEDAMDAVLSGESSSTILSAYRLSVMRANSRYNTLRSIPLEHGISYSFGLPKGNVALLSLLNRGIALVDESLINSIVTTYAGEGNSFTLADFVREHALAVTLTILAVALVIILLLIQILESVKRSRKIQAEQAAKLEDALAMAEGANQAKTSFLFNMSHDIRTPLNAIMGFTELAGKDMNDVAKQEDYRQKVILASKQLKDILNNVLEMARIENKKVEISEEPTDLSEFFRTWTSVFEGEIRNKNQILETSIDINHEALYLDTTHLSEVFMNVMSNAIKYTPDGGRITASVRELPADEEGRCIIETSIRDNGIGMSEEFTEKVFEEFARERSSSDSGIQGTGLGMAIVKELVELMQGAISINSRIGEGTEVILRIPHTFADASLLKRESDSTEQRRDFQGCRVLMAEDMDVNALLATEILTMHGFEVERARDGVECVDMYNKAEAGYYDLILMDIQMPNMNGYQATAHIREMPEDDKANIPIVALSANAFKEDTEKSMAAGMNGHIAKPIDVEEMLTILNEILEGGSVDLQ